MASMAGISSAASGSTVISGQTAQGALGGFAGNSALSGLFSLLMGFGESAEGVDGGLLSALLGGDTEGQADLLALLQGTTGAEGEAVDFAALFADIQAQLDALEGADVTSAEGEEGLATLLGQVQKAIQGLKQAAANGEITPELSEDEENLYLAFKEMGYPAQQALDMANQLEAAFDRLKSAQNEDGVDLLALFDGSADDMAASLLAQAGFQAEQSRVVQVSETIQGVTSQQASLSFQSQAKYAPITNLAEKIHGEQTLVPEVPQKQVLQGVPAVDEGMTEDGVVRDSAQIAPTQDAVKTHVNQVVERGVPADKPVLMGNEKALAAQTAHVDAEVVEDAVKTQTAQAVKAPTAIEGYTVFQWKQNDAGVDILQRPMDSTGTALLDGAVVEGMVDDVHEVAETEKTPSGKQLSFAEKMAQMARNAQLAQQVQPSVKALVEEGGGTVRVTLKPAELGEIEIELDIKDGTVQGKIASQNAEVAEQLARELHTLKQGLADAGLNLGENGIAFIVQDDQGEQGNNQFAGGEESGEQEAEDDEALAMTDIPAGRWVDPSRTLDMQV